MSTENANDVTKALAAFGAPSIRYHRFSQSQVKPSNVVIPRREPLTPLPIVVPAPMSTQPPILTQVSTSTSLPPAKTLHDKNQPDTISNLNSPPPPRIASFALPVSVSKPVVPMPPMPAFRRAMDPAATAFRATPVAPPRALGDHPADAPVSNHLPPVAQAAIQAAAVPRGVVLNAADGAAPNPAAGFRPMPPPLPPVSTSPAASGTESIASLSGTTAQDGSVPGMPLTDQRQGGDRDQKPRTLREIFSFIAGNPSAAPRSLRSFS